MSEAVAVAQTQSLLARIKGLLLKPRQEWPVIAGERTSIGGLMLSYVAVIAAIPVVAQMIGMLVFGISVLGVTYRPPIMTTLAGALGQYVLSLIAVGVIAVMIDVLAPKFGGRRNLTQAFKVAAYGSTATWLAGATALLPGISFLAILGAYSLYLLYLGLPVLMEAPKEKALAYTAVVVILAGLLFVVAGAITRPLMARPHGAALSGAFAGSVLSQDRVSLPTGRVSLPGGRQVDLGEMQQAVARAEKMTRNARDGAVAVVAAEKLAEFLPASIGRYRQVSAESSSVGAIELGGSRAEARYVLDDQYIELSVTDIPMAGPMAAIGAAMQVRGERKTATGYERTHVVDGAFVAEEWDQTTGQGSYTTMAGERFMITATGRVADMKELKAAVAAVRPDRIARLAG
nr:Yip1 family protein [Brevundimonas naejangsanensis]